MQWTYTDEYPVEQRLRFFEVKDFIVAIIEFSALGKVQYDNGVFAGILFEVLIPYAKGKPLVWINV